MITSSEYGNASITVMCTGLAYHNEIIKWEENVNMKSKNFAPQLDSTVKKINTLVQSVENLECREKIKN